MHIRILIRETKNEFLSFSMFHCLLVFLNNLVRNWLISMNFLWDWLAVTLQKGGHWHVSNHTMSITQNNWSLVCFLKLKPGISDFLLDTRVCWKPKGHGSKWFKLQEPLLPLSEIFYCIWLDLEENGHSEFDSHPIWCVTIWMPIFLTMLHRWLNKGVGLCKFCALPALLINHSMTQLSVKLQYCSVVEIMIKGSVDSTTTGGSNSPHCSSN